MKLSIGLIVKNEGKVLRQCLEALQPVLTRVDSELIIADTGSDDDTLEIAREFTPHVLQVQWNDNFAEARNYTVRAAKGEWFMYIDADEFLEDCTDLIQFFNTGEYLNYNSATLKQKNLVGEDQYDMFFMLRLVKMTRKTKFEGIIHEGLTNYPPRRDLNVNAYHTGYFYEGDPEKRRKKRDRNLTLLMRAYKRDPLDMRIVSLIANEYLTHRDMDDYKKYLDIGMDNLGKNPDHYMFHYFYHHIAQYYMMLPDEEQHQKAIELARDYLRLRKNDISVTTVDMYYFIGMAYHKDDKLNEALEHFEKSAALFQQYQDGQIDTTEAVFDILDCTRPNFQSHLYYLMALDYSLLNAHDKAFECYRHIDMPDHGVIDTYFELMEASEQHRRAVTLYGMVLALKAQNVTHYLAQREYMDIKIVSSPHMTEMLESFTTADMEEDDYIRLQRLRHAFFTDNDIGFLHQLSYFTQPEKFQELKEYQPNLYFNVGYMAIKKPLGFKQLLKVSEMDDADYLFEQMSALQGDLADIALTYAQNKQKQDPQTAYWLASLYGCAARSGEITDEQKTTLFKEYLAAMQRYMQAIFAPASLTDQGIPLLTGIYRFVYHAQKAQDALAAGDDLNYVRGMKTALPCDVRFSAVVQQLIHLLAERREKEKQKREKADEKLSELALLTHNLKAAIYQMIDAGQTENAKRLLTQYEAINPGDEGIAAIKRRLKP